MSLSYPIGKFSPPNEITPEIRQTWLADFQQLPIDFRNAAEDLAANQKLDTPYRPGGWTARQVIHHVPDSHVNAYVRIKLALTEDQPTIRPYQEAEWAKQPDYQQPIELSLQLLELLHQKMALVFQQMHPADWERAYLHPEGNAIVPMAEVLGHYVWHGRHHLGHLNLLR